jgi:hypothetical protein
MIADCIKKCSGISLACWLRIASDFASNLLVLMMLTRISEETILITIAPVMPRDEEK